MTIKMPTDPLIKEFAFAYSTAAQAADNNRKARELLFDNLPKYMKQIRRMSNRMTQRQLAEALGVDHSYISKIENGHLRPGMGFVADLYEYSQTGLD